MTRVVNSGSGILIVLAAALAASPAMSQVAAGSSAEASSPPGEEASLGEIVVTAQRRTELQRDVPIAITTIGVDQLQQGCQAAGRYRPGGTRASI